MTSSFDFDEVDRFVCGTIGEPGDRVTVFGPGGPGEPTVAAWAGWADTLEHEIVTGIGARVPRRTRAVPHLRSVR